MFNFLKSKKSDKPEPLIINTDIHSHVLPGIDDGAPTPEDGADIVEALAELGISRMLVTPHVTNEVFPNTTDTIDKALAALRGQLDARNATMQIIPSAEYRIDDLLHEYLDKGTVRPYPGDYILIECPWINKPFGLEAFIHKLKEKHGYKPILAHPERYPYFHSDMQTYARLHDIGVRFQVNLLSLAGYYGTVIKKCAETLLDKGLVEFIGTDAHNMRHIKVIRHYLCSNDYRKLQQHAATILNDTIFGK